MFKYILQRIFYTIPVILGACTLTFSLIHIVPGDPVDLMLGDQATNIDKNLLRENLGLNKPFLEQYFDFISGFATFDLGTSIHQSRPAGEMLLERLPATIELTIGAMLLAIVFGIPLGIMASLKTNSWFDHAVIAISMLGISIPGIFLGPMLIWMFAMVIPIFPVSDRGGLEHLFLPALSLAIPLSAVIIRMTRASMVEVVKQDYIRVAKAKGNSFYVIYFKHALKNALSPIVTVIGLQTGALLTGTVITETIFDWPGLGTLLFESIQRRDYPVVQACILTVALIYIVVNLITDLSYGFLNPKVRLNK